MTAEQFDSYLVKTIKKAITGSKFAALTVRPEDATKEVKRPSIKYAVDCHISREMLQKHSSISVEIFFYPEDGVKYKKDCYIIRDLLEAELMNGIDIGDDIMEVNDIDIAITGNVLSCNFAIDAFESLFVETGESMETLDWRL